MKKYFIGTLTGIFVGFGLAYSASSISFEDVTPDAWYYDEVMQLANWGVVEGRNDGKYYPADYVNRAELAAIINRYHQKVVAPLINGEEIATIENTDDNKDETYENTGNNNTNNPAGQSTLNGITTITYDFKNFSAIEVISPYDMNVKKGDTFSVKVEIDEEDAKYVSVNMTGSTLKLAILCENCTIDKKLTAVITMPSLQALTADGAANFDVSGFNEEKSEFELNGASSGNVSMNAQNLEVTLNGASDLFISGSGKTLTAEVDGASDFDADNFQVENATLNIDGASNAEVFVTESLNAEVNGASELTYLGNPKSTDIDTDESSSVN